MGVMVLNREAEMCMYVCVCVYRCFLALSLNRTDNDTPVMMSTPVLITSWFLNIFLQSQEPGLPGEMADSRTRK